MAASSGFSSGLSSSISGDTEVRDDADVEFGSFVTAERTSDPYADVYGATTDFSDPAGAPNTQEAAATAVDGASLMSFSPLAPAQVPTTTPPLLTTLSSDTDPFADITGGLGAAADAGHAAVQVETGDSSGGAEADTSASARSAILDLVWARTSQGTEVESKAEATSGASGDGEEKTRSRRSSNASGFMLPPPPSSQSTSSPAEASTGDLLSFSPVKATTPSDPFFGISDDASGSGSGAAAFGDNDFFSLTAKQPLSASSSAPGSLHGSFASLHESIKPPANSPMSPALGADKSTRDPFAERTTRSFGSLNSSFVSVGTTENTVASFDVFTTAVATFSAATSGLMPSPSSAPSSIHNSFNMKEGFVGFAPAADESEDADPFEEAGLSFEQVPLADALAAWNTPEQPASPADQQTSQEIQTAEDKELVADNLTTVSEPVAQQSVATAEESDAVPNQTRDHDVENLDGVESHNEEDVSVAALKIGSKAAAPFDFDSPVSLEPVAPKRCSSYSEPMNPVPFTDDSEMHALGLQNGVLDDDESDSAESCEWTTSGDEITSPTEHRVVEEEDSLGGSHTKFIPFSAPTTNEDTKVKNVVSDSYDELALATKEDLATGFVKMDDVADVKEEIHEQIGGGDDNFGDFGGFEAAAPAETVVTAPDTSDWGSFPAPTRAPTMPIEDEDDDFGDFTVVAPPVVVPDTPALEVEKDDFADFEQSNNDFDNFGDFAQNSAQEGFSDFQQSSQSAFGEEGDGFVDFTPAVAHATTSTVSSPSISAPTFSKEELSNFFLGAFPMEPLSPSFKSQTETTVDAKPADIIQDSSTDFVQDVFRNMWDEYISIVSAADHRSSSSSLSSSPSDSGEHVRLGKKTARASKYLKYVLSEKIQEASRQNGIFPHGSERHQMYIGFAATGDADRMRAALKELQDALFHNSVNDAMMRIAKEAALSAKAKIAEQAAQQQANSRGGSLFSTTRHLLSRGGGIGGAHGPGSSGSDNKGEHAGADTPTGASVQKLARFSFTIHDDTANGHRGMSSGDERGSEGSDHTGHSSGSDNEAVVGAGDARRGQFVPNTKSGSSNGGLMKKFQDRFSFASSRHKPRFVSLRREGQSGEEVRKMELNLDAINGGLDEVKWKCAMFLYDVEEVAHVAPSQIRILAYPSKQPLSGKTDRSALTKLVKPDTIWTVDIGANNSDMLNEW